MGKRKYEPDSVIPEKKTKNEELPDLILQSKEETEVQPLNSFNLKVQDSIGSFDIKHFRKELSSKQGQTSVLTQFLQVCLNPDNEVDYIAEYLKSGGNSHEILRQITQDGNKNLSLATPTFHIFHLIILKVQSSLPHLIAITEEACRFFLNTFMSTVEIMISENSGPRHRKVILKLLTSIVTLNPDLGIEVLSQAPLTPKHLQYIVEKTNYKEKDNVRTAFVHFITSFLIDNHLPLVKALLEKQGLLPLVIPGLLEDEPDAVLMLLNILKQNVIDNNLISKTLKLKTFSHQVLHNIFKIYSWKGPPEISSEDKNLARPQIVGLLSNIITTLFTSHRLGLYFVDKSLGTSDMNKNQNLYKALLTLKRPWENEYQCSCILNIISKCPDLHRAIITVIEQSFEPQHSPIWERTTYFFIKLLDQLKPEEMFHRMENLAPAQVANFIRFVTLPVPILKCFQKHIGQDFTISLYCIKVLVKMLEVLKSYIKMLSSDSKNSNLCEIKNKLDYFLPKHLPISTVIVTMIENVMKKTEHNKPSNDFVLPKVDNVEAMIYLMDLLLLYHEIHPPSFEMLEGYLDMKRILDYSTTLTSGNTSILKFKIVSLWLTLDSTAISLNNPIFKEMLHILLHVYTDDENVNWLDAKDTLYNFLKNTTIFATGEDEIHLLLYTLRNSEVDPVLIGDILEYVIKNMTSLNEHLKNQIVHFEITDQKCEIDLDTLFNNLMDNLATDDTVFVETKTPSSFVVGCIQYIQENKELKKKLSQFLCLYIANLLHWNYSPELTELFIGDIKLDVRNYVANWINKATVIPEGLLQENNVLYKLSDAVMSFNDIELKSIFTCLEDEIDNSNELESNACKVNTDIPCDSSELVTLAKYLLYCTIRLTNLNQIQENQLNKITEILECIISIAKKYHMFDVINNILLSIFQNSHFIKIYQPIDVNKNDANILTTRFLINLVQNHRESINLLNERIKILKPFQQKNCNAVVKSMLKIKKRKNINCEHTLEVLKVIELSDEDDLFVLEHIFKTELNACAREDKEPSIVLEVLSVFLEKYSASAKKEFNPDTIKKIMKLYTDLLTTKDFNVNLTKLEHSLIAYFDMKPQQAKFVSAESYKRFFQGAAVRKSTSQLATKILEFNSKLCKTVADELARPEILSQRELALPLGDTLIRHAQFVNSNRDVLSSIYREYKTNIVKLLEKPHKAGQIFILCKDLIRKLVAEFTDAAECAKLFSKVHKYEAVEIFHVELVQAAFAKVLVEKPANQKETLSNYYLTVLNLFTTALKEDRGDATYRVLVASTYRATRAVEATGAADGHDFGRVTGSGAWPNFCRAVLKHSLRVRTADEANALGPRMLQLLTALLRLLHPPDHAGVAVLFDTVTAHSEFLNVMLSHHSPDVKARLVELLAELAAKSAAVMRAQHVPVYLSAYHATRAPADRLLLRLLRQYEARGLPLSEFRPYVFGDAAASHYAVRRGRASLWAHPTPNLVMDLFERGAIERTVQRLPAQSLAGADAEAERPFDGSAAAALDKMFKDDVFRPSAGAGAEAAVQKMHLRAKYAAELLALGARDLAGESAAGEGGAGGAGGDVYDLGFVLPLLGHLLAPGTLASSFKLLRCGLLALPVAALGSLCPLTRAAACHVLHRFCLLLDTETRHRNDKLLLTDFLETLRHTLASVQNGNKEENGTEDLKSPRLPAIGALFLARALLVSTAPLDPLFKPINNFLIAKQSLDLSVVPDFLSLFHDSDVETADRRRWILSIIEHGAKTMSDVNIVFKTMCLKMIMDFYSTVLCDKKTKCSIVNAIKSLVAIPRAMEILVEGYGLVSWLDAVVKEGLDRTLVRDVLALLRTMFQSIAISALSRKLKGGVKNKNGKTVEEFNVLKVDRELEHELLVILYNLFQNLKEVNVDDALVYLDAIDSLNKSIRLLSKPQMNSLLTTIGACCKNEDIMKLLTRTIFSNNAVLLKSKMFDSDFGESEGLLIKKLLNLVKCYISI